MGLKSKHNDHEVLLWFGVTIGLSRHKLNEEDDVMDVAVRCGTPLIVSYIIW